jgi:hypothetical protein
MRGFKTARIQWLCLALTPFLSSWPAAPGHAAVDEPYASARECLRSVSAAEDQARTLEGKAGAEVGYPFDQARDLCMQSRYQQVQEIIGNVTTTAEPN